MVNLLLKMDPLLLLCFLAVGSGKFCNEILGHLTMLCLFILFMLWQKLAHVLLLALGAKIDYFYSVLHLGEVGT